MKEVMARRALTKTVAEKDELRFALNVAKRVATTKESLDVLIFKVANEEQKENLFLQHHELQYLPRYFQRVSIFS